jgi:hypothetical protein
MPRNKETKAAWERAHKAERTKRRAKQRSGARTVTKRRVATTREERIAARIAALPVERVTGNIKATPENIPTTPESRGRFSIPARKKQIRRISKRKRIADALYYWMKRYHAQAPRKPGDTWKGVNTFFGTGRGPNLFEKPTDVTKEIRLEEQSKRAQAEAEWDELEYEGSNRPHWTFQSLLIEAKAELEAGLEREQRNEELRGRSEIAEKDRKERRKAFDAATRKPVKKTKASDDPMGQTKELLEFFNWWVEQPQKAVSKQSIVEEIARLEKLVDNKARAQSDKEFKND